MADRRNPGDDEGREREEDRQRSRRPPRSRTPGEHRAESGDDPLRHAMILQRRWLGSPPPTAGRYARALAQWRALPGAVVSPGTGMTTTSDAGDES
jgi:hypothetical protein